MNDKTTRAQLADLAEAKARGLISDEEAAHAALELCGIKFHRQERRPIKPQLDQLQEQTINSSEMVSRQVMAWHAGMTDKALTKRLINGGMMIHEADGRNRGRGCFRLTNKGSRIAIQRNRNIFILFDVGATLHWLNLPRRK